MSQAELEIVISPQGKVSIEVQGLQGPQCTDLTAFLENALGSVDERTFKAEYYTHVSTDIQNQQY